MYTTVLQLAIGLSSLAQTVKAGFRDANVAIRKTLQLVENIAYWNERQQGDIQRLHTACKDMQNQIIQLKLTSTAQDRTISDLSQEIIRVKGLLDPRRSNR